VARELQSGGLIQAIVSWALWIAHDIFSVPGGTWEPSSEILKI